MYYIMYKSQKFVKRKANEIKTSSKVLKDLV